MLRKKISKGTDTKQENNTKKNSGYFDKANSWADDLTTSVIVSRNRYRIAFFVMAALCGLLVVAVMVLAPLQHVQLVVVHEDKNGYNWVTTAQVEQSGDPSWQRTKSELAHYVDIREGYDPSFYAENGSLINLQSSPTVYTHYLQTQSRSNPNSPVNALGNKGIQNVSIQSILLLDSADRNKHGVTHHRNLAEVHFTVIRQLNGQSKTHEKYYTTLIGWKYGSPPSSPVDLLHNWDGFQVTDYQRTPVTYNQHG